MGPQAQLRSGAGCPKRGTANGKTLRKDQRGPSEEEEGHCGGGKGQGLQVNSRSPDHPRLHRPSSQTPAQTEGCSSQTLGSPSRVFDSADWRGGLRLCISNPLPWEAGTALKKPPLRTTALRPEQGVWISRRGHGRQIIRDRK